MGPHTGKPWQEVFILRKFNLCFCIGSFRTLGENIKDQVCTVEHPDFQLLFNISHLAGRQFIIKNDDIDFLLYGKLVNLLQFSAANICACIGRIKPLNEFFYGNCSCSFNQKSKLIKIVIHQTDILVIIYYAY